MIGYSDYTIELMVRDRQAMVQRLAAERALVALSRGPALTLRARLGLALIQAGRMLAGHRVRWAARQHRLA